MQVYADNASTTQLCQAASDAMLLSLCADYGNPSSLHQKGQAAATKIEEARAVIAARIGAAPEEIYFTSGGTEADNWAVYSAAMYGTSQGKKHIISSKIEHHAILNPLARLEKQGFEITLLEVAADGTVLPPSVEQAIREDTALVTIMFANNEIGTIQPIKEIGAICHRHGIPFHTDAVQAVGHIPVDVQAQAIDMLSLSAHKFHGPTGVGALYCRADIPLIPFMVGGAQEQGKRAGTENMRGIVGMAAALASCCADMDATRTQVSALRDKLIAAIREIPGAKLTGSEKGRLPGNVHFCFEGVGSTALLMALDMHGICASSGAACAAHQSEPSHVLAALRLPEPLARGALRLSLSGHNTPEENDYIINTLPKLIGQLRVIST